MPHRRGKSSRSTGTPTGLTGTLHRATPDWRATWWIDCRRVWGSMITTSIRRSPSRHCNRAANRAARTGRFSSTVSVSTNRSMSPPRRLSSSREPRRQTARSPSGGSRVAGHRSDEQLQSIPISSRLHPGSPPMWCESVVGLHEGAQNGCLVGLKKRPDLRVIVSHLHRLPPEHPEAATQAPAP